MKIGNIKIHGNLFLAPMADVTNPAFRMLCKKYGAALTYSEMISADAVLHENARTTSRGLSCEEEKPFAIQLFGNSATTISDAASIVEEKYAPDIIDINLGCPAKVLVKDGSGSALLEFPEKIRDIISSVYGKVSVPVTAKIRVLRDMRETLEIAKIIEEAGASAITVHGRTQAQQYAGKAEHKYAKNIKNELSISVIANGDIVDGYSAKQIIDYTECDALMIGRAAMSNPHVFRDISHFLRTGEQINTDECSQRIADFKEYMRLLELYGLEEHVDIRMHAQWFTRGIKGGRHVRQEISKTLDKKSIIQLMDSLCTQFSEKNENSNFHGN
ncbi:tRNA dihydrouridine synthase DusB [uncultured Methanomethylovorans sp.]|uniref:tRNA dihydrouridine synthase DusB n=1 Tax=uncultured Methanomethylovorans sp. TaxID=183759 RepID=UPI002AA84C0E|nr:tRNA dihydrouridine synthase DusB [uncultured Methanomethylovorans sp.]